MCQISNIPLYNLCSFSPSGSWKQKLDHLFQRQWPYHPHPFVKYTDALIAWTAVELRTWEFAGLFIVHCYLEWKDISNTPYFSSNSCIAQSNSCSPLYLKKLASPCETKFRMWLTLQHNKSVSLQIEVDGMGWDGTWWTNQLCLAYSKYILIIKRNTKSCIGGGESAR